MTSNTPLTYKYSGSFGLFSRKKSGHYILICLAADPRSLVNRARKLELDKKDWFIRLL